MLITNHVLAGASIGLLSRSPTVAAASGLLSHFAMDALPHWGICDHRTYVRTAIVDGAIGIGLSVAVVSASPPAHRTNVLSGILGACFPDTDQAAVLIFGRTYQPAWFDRVHAGVQNEHDWLGQEPIVALALAGVFTWVLRRTRRRG